MKKLNIIVKENEEKVLPFVWINGEENETTVTVRLKGNNSRLHIVGIFVGTKNNSVTFNTEVIHEGLHTYSRTDLRCVFQDRGVFSNDALINIQKGAKNTDGFFTSKVLLFDDARGRSVPSLEIDENEVKAGHASTIGRPNKDQMFYLQSRGLSEKEAEKLIISGFFEPVLKYFPKDEQKNLHRKIHSVL